MKPLTIASLLLSSVLLSGQTPEKTEPKESAEFKFARQRWEKLHDQFEDRVKAFTKAVAEAGKYEKCQTTNNTCNAKYKALYRDAQKLDAEANELKPLEEFAAQQFRYATTCAEVFHQTINKKVSELTVLETSQMTECRNLDSYPPEVETKNGK